MGGDGSGRKPDPIKAMLQQMTPPINTNVCNAMILPNLSGVKHEIKEGTSNITSDDLKEGSTNKFFSEAPIDGSTYGRKNAGWEIVSATETDTLQTVTERGATTTEDVELSNTLIKGTFENYNPDINDMGLELTSDLRGYGSDYVTEKAITHCSIGYNDTTIDGGLRYYDGDLQVYRVDSWDTILAGVAIVTDETEIPLDVELTNFDYTLSLITGDSDELDFNGEPIVQQMHVPMGCYASRQYLNGGTF